MLNKLALRNAERSLKDYIIYLITVTLSFSFIFAFNLISYSEDVLNLSSMMVNFKYVMYFVNGIIIFVICFLINYTTKFIFKKRSKEFGTYLILGIKKRQITSLFTRENIVLGSLSFLLSLPLGYLFSKIMSYIMMNIFELPKLV
ncbi:MAG: FtsX-like permease family protein, partial [Bacilli bacterium]|nr:FtsX-like permease family protein [Bacilli bacterium]